MPEYVRVKDKSTGHKYSQLARKVEANPDAYQVLKQDAVDAAGRPLPTEFAAPESLSSTTHSGPEADPKKES